MNFLDEHYLEQEKQRLLQKYGCSTIEEVIAKQEQNLRAQSLKIQN
jgi:hypothetical protein